MAGTSVRVAGVVVKWVRGDKEANIRRVEPLIRAAAAGGAQIVCTTECFLDGYAIADKGIPLAEYRALGEPIPGGPFYRRLAALAAELRVHLVAGMTEADGEARHNTAALIGPDGGLIGRYRKQCLGHEAGRNTAGSESPVFETAHGRLGIMICADRHQPEIAGAFARDGAGLVLCPSGGTFGPQRNDPVVQARSRETGLPVVFVHPAEFLVTGPDGGNLACALVGDRLLVSPEEVGGPADPARLFCEDVPLSPLTHRALGAERQGAEPVSAGASTRSRRRRRTARPGAG